jgi:hypothetical protein
MSTPPGDSRDPTDGSADRSHEISRRAGPERQDDGDDHDRFRYPQPGARRSADAERHPASNANDPLRSPYAPRRARTQPMAEAARRNEDMGDLERLVTSLYAIHSEEAVARMPRATQLPPVAGLAPVDERFDAGEPSPYSLEAERLIPPEQLMSRSDRLRRPLYILAATILAAPIAYYALIAGWGPPPARGPQTESVGPAAVAPPSASAGPAAVAPPSTSQDRRQPIRAEADDAGQATQNEAPAERGKTSRTARLPEGRTMAALQPNAVTREPPSSSAVRTLDPEEIRVLVKQGEQFAEAGDLAGARILFQRAAEAGDATAATALGATYDPTVFSKLGVVGIGADLEKARFWYQKAASLGSADARRRLDLLANR